MSEMTEVRSKIEIALRREGVSPVTKGFRYLADCCEIYREVPALGLHRHVIPEIAGRYSVTDKSVARAIRYAMERAGISMPVKVLVYEVNSDEMRGGIVVKIKRLTETSVVPTRADKGSVGFDLYSDSLGETITVSSGESRIISTGIAMEIPKGWWGGVYARSGLSYKEGLRLSTPN